jgi:hypothetical protein
MNVQQHAWAAAASAASSVAVARKAGSSCISSRMNQIIVVRRIGTVEPINRSQFIEILHNQYKNSGENDEANAIHESVLEEKEILWMESEHYFGCVTECFIDGVQYWYILLPKKNAAPALSVEEAEPDFFTPDDAGIELEARMAELEKKHFDL